MNSDNPTRSDVSLLSGSLDNSGVNLSIRETPAGRGIFTETDIDLKTSILSVHGIRIKALNDTRLVDTCYYCQRGPKDDQEVPGSNATSLKLCTGCKTVRYCSSACQKSSWTQVHKRECKIFKSLYPRVLPSNVRAVMCLLDGSSLDAVLALKDHLQDLQEAGGDRWQDLCLSAKAAKVYSGTGVDETLILRLFGILMTNSFTMITAMYDPIGVAMHPTAALLNHSCEYNATVRFGDRGDGMEVVPIRPIKRGEEILISYIDELLPLEERRAMLKEQYFFTCSCLRCTREASKPNPSLSPAAETAYSTAISLLSSSADPATIKSAIRALHAASHPPTAYPLPSLRQSLITSYLSTQQYELAFIHAMIQSFHLDPIVYPATHHPLRLVHAWLCVRIVDCLLSEVDEHGKELQETDLHPFKIDLPFWRRAMTISLFRAVNVGPPGRELSKIVTRRHEEEKRIWLAEMMGRYTAPDAYEVQHSSKKVLETKWVPVEAAIVKVMKEEERDGDDNREKNGV